MYYLFCRNVDRPVHDDPVYRLRAPWLRHRTGVGHEAPGAVREEPGHGHVGEADRLAWNIFGISCKKVGK